MIETIPQGPYCIKFNGGWSASGGNILPYDRTDAFTMFAWIKYANNVGGYIVSRMDNTPDGWGFTLEANGTIKIIANEASGTGALSVTTARSIGNGWHSVAVVKAATGATATDYTVYFDGVAVSKATATLDTFTSGTMVNGSQVLRIGGRSTTPVAPSNLFVKNLCLYSSALTSGNIVTLHAIGRDGDYSSTLTPAANWRCNDPTKEHTTILDYSGNARNVTVDSGRSNYRAQCGVGPATYAVNLDGVDEYITFGDNLGFERNQTRSICAWFKGTATSPIISKQAATSARTGPNVTVDTVGLRFNLISDLTTFNYLDARATVTLLDNVWHFIVVTYDGSSSFSGINMYVDGVTLTPSNLNVAGLSATILNSVALDIGRNWVGSSYSYAGGKISNVAIYDKVLDSTDRTALYASRSFADFTQVGPTANLIGYWPMCGLDSTSANGVLDLSAGNHPGSSTNIEAGDFIPIYSYDTIVFPSLPPHPMTPSFFFMVEPGNYTPSGGNITQLNDLSGNGNHVTGTATLSTSWRNGHGAISNNGSNTFFRSTLTQGTLAQPTTYYVVGDWGTSNTSASKFWFDGRSDTNNRNMIYQNSNASGGNAGGFAPTGSPSDIGVLAPFGQTCIARAVIQSSNPALRIEPNGATVITGTQSYGSGGMAGLSLLTDYVGVRPWTGGTLAFLVAYPARIVPDSAEDIAILSWLRVYYNVHATGF